MHRKAHMNRQQKSTLADYIGWLFRKLQELNKAQEAAVTYRLINVEEIGSKQKLTIQVVGTAQTFSIAPKKILSNDAMVEHFSSKDIRTITYYATKALTQPKNKIVIKKIIHILLLEISIYFPFLNHHHTHFYMVILHIL